MLAIPLNGLDAVDTKTSKLFGKAPYILLISPDGSANVLQNEFASGKKLAGELIRLGVKTLIVNHLGKKAFEALSLSDVNIYFNDENSSVLLALDAYRAGALIKFEADMTQEEKHRNEGECEHEGHGGECCGDKHEHSDGKRCCEKEGHKDADKKREGNGRCCQNK